MLTSFRFSILTNCWQWLVVIAIVSLLASIFAPRAFAQGPVVDTAIDENDGSCMDGDCSLRDAIATANSGETITFAGNFTIYLDSTLQISKTLAIDGSGLTITLSGDSSNDGSRDVQVLAIQNSPIVTLTNLNVISGARGISSNGILTINDSAILDNWAPSDFDAGGLLNFGSGIMTINHSMISGNRAYSSGGIDNGIRGTLIVINSTISGNQAEENIGGGIENSGVATIINSTFSGNWALGAGGGLLNNSGTTTIINSTFSENQSFGGGGIVNFGATLHLLNTIVANNIGGDCSNQSTASIIGTNSYNLIEDGSCNVVDGGSPVGFLTGDPLLGPLADNGGPTWTHALLTGSPAIDQGDPSFDPNTFSPPMTNDQRGSGFDRVINSRVDIGAFEFGTSSSPPDDVNIFLPIIIKN